MSDLMAPLFESIPDMLGINVYGIGPVIIAYLVGAIISIIVSVIGKRMNWPIFDDLWY